MSYSVVNIDPPNYSVGNDIDTEIFFKVLGLSESDLKDFSVFDMSEIIFKDGSFSPNYENSYYQILEDGISFNIDKSSDYSKGERVVVKIFYPQEINFIYHIKIQSEAPYLYHSNISTGDVVKESKIISLEFGDHFDTLSAESISSIKINGYSVITNGIVDDFFSNNISISNESFLKVDIDHPEFFKSGKYTLEYTIKNSSGSRLLDKIKFDIKLRSPILPSVFPQARFEGFNLGLDTVTSNGDGSSATLEWHKFLSRYNKSEVFSLIYVNEDRLSVFDSDPSYITPPGVATANIEGLTTGRATSVAVRGMEAFKGVFDLSGMQTNNSGVYLFPEETFLSEPLLSTSLEIFADSTLGYPSKGLLVINSSEVVRYSSKTDSSFIVTASGRGLNNTSAVTHPSTATIKLFYKCQDKNTNIGVVTASYTMGEDFDRQDNMVGTAITDLTTDDKRFFQGFDYCGYHQALPNLILEGKDECGSYLGGEFNKQRGFNIFDRVQSRNEVLLEQVGEPIILLKRKWSGQNCDCMDSRRQHPRDKTCSRCFGTGFLGGFDQFSNNRRNDGRVLVRFKETKHDLSLTNNKHLNVVMDPQCWTLPLPSIRDRDIIVRFGFLGEVEYMYEVLDVTKERFVYKHYGRQNLSLKRLDKTDIMYTFRYVE